MVYIYIPVLRILWDKGIHNFPPEKMGKFVNTDVIIWWNNLKQFDIYTEKDEQNMGCRDDFFYDCWSNQLLYRSISK